MDFIKNTYVYELSKNPYYLTHILCYRSRHNNATAQEVISFLIDKLIKKRWPISKYEKYGINVENIREILSYIAWDMAVEDEHRIPSHLLSKKFSEAAANIIEVDADVSVWNGLVKEINVRAGLLILDNNEYCFQNDVMEHLLAAERICTELFNRKDNKDDKYELFKFYDERLKDIGKDYWSDILVMMFTPVGGKMTEKITTTLYKYLLYRTSESFDEDELKVIVKVFLDILQNTFGANRISSYKKTKQINIHEKQICRFLTNNMNLLNDSMNDFIKDFIEDVKKSNSSNMNRI